MAQELAKVTDITGKSFDFAVIGGGLSGCVLASRLSENPDISVALLEAGKAHFDDPLISTPDGWMKQILNPEYDWIFKTLPQKKAMNSITTPDGQSHPTFYWSRGKSLGGSTGINFCLWTRPQREEINAIEKLGSTGWNWERFYQASKRAERFVPPVNSNDEDLLELYQSESVGHNGPLPISFSKTVSKLELPFQKSLEAHGIDIIKDSISGTFKSMSIIDPQTGTRSHAAKGYLIPALDRPNLKVLAEAYVRRIITSDMEEEAVATGVEFECEGQTYTVDVAKEAILTAGTIKSPHILEMSGIGDRNILEPLGINVKVNLPSVGTNVQDHLIHGAYVYEMQQGHDFVTSDTIRRPELQAKLREAYAGAGGDPSLALSGVTFLPIQSFSERADELIEKQGRKIREQADKLPAGLKEQYDIQLEYLKQNNVPDIEIVVFPFSLSQDDSGRVYSGLLPSIGHPFSRGTIHASSSDPNVQPDIDPNYFADEFDLEVLLEAFKFLRKVTETSPWKDLAEKELLPGPDVSTDEQIREFIQKNLSTTWHTCGSCSLLPKEKGGVVDTKLKVYGTKNIRVADLSILPIITAVHTQATTYGIAEQVVDILRADYGF